MGEKLRQAAPESAIETHRKRRRHVEAVPCTSAAPPPSGESACPPPLLELLRRERKQLQSKEPEDAMAFLSEVYGPDSARQAIELQTRDQASSPAWHNYRSGLVTASIAHTCMTKARTFLRSKKNVTIEPLLKVILQKTHVRTTAMREGAEKEAIARDTYKQWMEAQGHELTIKTVGLILHPEFPFIACSPDGIVSFSCRCCAGKEIILEIKCPQKLENSFANFDDLEPKREYLTQLQVQMGVCGKMQADFFVYNAPLLFCGTTVDFNSSIFEGFKDTIIEVYKTKILRELVTRVGGL
ncbi:hypothetical protein MTO96_049855 [Rhipicephalus appendiculatus]